MMMKQAEFICQLDELCFSHFFLPLSYSLSLERDRIMLICSYICSLMIFCQITLECLTPFSINVFLWHIAMLKNLGNFLYLRRTPWEIINHLPPCTGCVDGLKCSSTRVGSLPRLSSYAPQTVRDLSVMTSEFCL